MNASTSHETDLIRFGYHGSLVAAHSIVREAGADPDIGFEFTQYELTDPFRMLRNDELDVMIAKFAMREPDLSVGPCLAHDARAALLSDHHPLADETSLSIEQIAAFPAFHRPGRMPEYVWDIVVPPRSPSGRLIRRVHRSSTVEQMISVLRSTQAVHMSLVSLAAVAPSDIRVIPIEDLPAAPVMLVWRGSTPSRHLARILGPDPTGNR